MLKSAPGRQVIVATESDVSGRKSSANVKHSLSVAGHRTSITLEQAFWDGLRAIARRRGEPVASLVARIDADRGGANLSSAIRVFVLNATAAASRDGAANEPGSGVSEASFEGL